MVDGCCRSDAHVRTMATTPYRQGWGCSGAMVNVAMGRLFYELGNAFVSRRPSSKEQIMNFGYDV